VYYFCYTTGYNFRYAYFDNLQQDTVRKVRSSVVKTVRMSKYVRYTLISDLL
jgi:hypothetical protein